MEKVEERGRSDVSNPIKQFQHGRYDVFLFCLLFSFFSLVLVFSSCELRLSSPPFPPSPSVANI